MKIIILSREATSYSIKRLIESASDRGHEVEVIDTIKCTLYVERSYSQVFYRSNALDRVDAVIPRIGASITSYGTAVVRQFEQMKIFTLNSSEAISSSRNKFHALQILSQHHIGIPKTIFLRDQFDLLTAIQKLGGSPTIIKLLEGTHGIGVMLAESNEMAQSLVETFHWAKHHIILQQFISESKGRDVRAIVVGNRVVAAMRRRSKGNEFRSNLHRGGVGEKIDLPIEYQKTAIHAAQILGLRVAGVDMLEANGGPLVLEVNSSPGLEGIEMTTGINVASEIVQLVEKEVFLRKHHGES